MNWHTDSHLLVQKGSKSTQEKW